MTTWYGTIGQLYYDIKIRVHTIKMPFYRKRRIKLQKKKIKVRIRTKRKFQKILHRLHRNLNLSHLWKIWRHLHSIAITILMMLIMRLFLSTMSILQESIAMNSVKLSSKVSLDWMYMLLWSLTLTLISNKNVIMACVVMKLWNFFAQGQNQQTIVTTARKIYPKKGRILWKLLIRMIFGTINTTARRDSKSSMQRFQKDQAIEFEKETIEIKIQSPVK